MQSILLLFVVFFCIKIKVMHNNQCWISPAVTFWSTFYLYKYAQGKSGLPESAPDCQVFKIKTDESEYRTQGTSLRHG